MNRAKEVLLFIRDEKLGQVLAGAGCIASFAGGYQVGKKRLRRRYEEIASQEIAEARSYYDEFYRKYHKAEKYDDPLHVGSKTLPQQQEEQTPQGLESTLRKTDYNKVTPTNTVPDVKVAEGALARKEPVPAVSVFDPPTLAPDKRDHSKPYVISKGEFDEAEGDFVQSEFTFFDEDHVLVDANDEPIREVELYVGEGPLQFGSGSGDENVVYMRNEKLEIDFTILRAGGSYSRDVLGFGRD